MGGDTTIVRHLEIALKVCVILIGVLLSIVISGGTVGWAKGKMHKCPDREASPLHFVHALSFLCLMRVHCGMREVRG